MGSRVRVKVVKNKVAPPFRQAEFDLMFGEGVSKEGCILDMAADAGIVNKSGSWFAYKEEKLGQGREAAKYTLKTNIKLRDEIEKQVRAAFGFPDAQESKPKAKEKSEKAKDDKTNDEKRGK